MMKKLLLWSALLMTGFAFYSCDDVIDNPAQGDSTVWKCTTNVTFADFDFKGLTDPESGEKYAYEAPKTLYVFNEQLEPLGTITTTTPPSAGATGKYSGNLCGVISDNLILTTKIGTDYSKQDGTIKSVVENGIVQVAKVGVRLYSNYNHELVTYDANMENEVAIAHIEMGWLKADDEITITSENIASEDKSLTIKIGEDVNTSDLFVAIPTETSKGFDYSLSANKANGEVAGAKMEDLTLEKGKINTLNKETMEPYHVGQKVLGVDLTKYDAYMRSSKDPNDAWYMNNINNGGIPSYWYGEGDDYSFIVTQSGEATLDSLNVIFSGNIDKKATLTISNVRLGKDCYFEVQNGATFDITLIGENKFGMLNLNSPFAKKGTGTWEFNELNIGGNANVSGTDLVVDYAAEYTINEDMTLKHLSVYRGGKLTIAEGKKVTVINDEQRAVSVYQATLSLGKGATLQAECKVKDQAVITIENATFNVGENAIVTAQGGKDGTGLSINNYSYSSYNATSNVNIGKNATVTLIGGPEGVLGSGININNNYNATTNITLDEGAKVNATGIDRYGINCNATDWSSYTNAITINIAKNAKITAEDVESGVGFYAYTYHSTVTIDGEGTLEAKSKDGVGMQLENGYQAVINFKGGNISAISGGDNPAITCNNYPFTIAPEIKSFKAQKGANATQYITRWGSEVDLANIVADETKFDDKTEAGVRTITPKPAEE
jgi:hypothetical protein